MAWSSKHNLDSSSNWKLTYDLFCFFLYPSSPSCVAAVFTCINTVDMLSFPTISLRLSTTYGSCLYSCLCNCTVVVYSNGSNTDLHISGCPETCVLRQVGMYVIMTYIPAQAPSVPCLVLPKPCHLNYSTPPRRSRPPIQITLPLQCNFNLLSLLMSRSNWLSDYPRIGKESFFVADFINCMMHA